MSLVLQLPSHHPVLMAATKNSDCRMGFGDQRDFTTLGRTLIPEVFPADLSATSKHLLYRKMQFSLYMGFSF